MLLFFKSEGLYSQQICITAGETLTHYYNPEPDFFLEANSLPTSFNLDINNDSIPDFIFSYYYYCTSFGVDSYFKVEGIDSNKVLIDQNHISQPKFLSFNEQICDSSMWQSSAYFFNCNSFGYFDNTDWLCPYPDSRYVGLKIMEGNSSVFGWASVYYGDYKLYLHDYACGIKVPETGVIGYPNPTNDFINIYVSNDNSSPYRLQLYNSRGDIVYENYGNEKKIDVHSMPAGIYILRLITKDKTISQKIVVTSK